MIQVEKIFSDHMMLQRNCENRIYGKDFAHEKIGLLLYIHFTKKTLIKGN